MSYIFGPLRHLSTRQILVATRPIPSVILTARVSLHDMVQTCNVSLVDTLSG